MVSQDWVSLPQVCPCPVRRRTHQHPPTVTTRTRTWKVSTMTRRCEPTTRRALGRSAGSPACGRTSASSRGRGRRSVEEATSSVLERIRRMACQKCHHRLSRRPHRDIEIAKRRRVDGQIRTVGKERNRCRLKDYHRSRSFGGRMFLWMDLIPMTTRMFFAISPLPPSRQRKIRKMKRVSHGLTTYR